MSSIILFRYHRDFDVCIQTLRQLRRLNPSMQIHGMYGGEPQAIIPSPLIDLLDSNWTIPIDDPFYKWKNGDLCARLWFRQRGQFLSFDHMYFVEWDMLFVRPLREVYGHIQTGANYATIFGDYAHAQATGWWWIEGHYGMETSWLLENLGSRGMPVDLTSLEFGNLGGSVFCRPYLERLIAEQVPSYSNDELRLSVCSRAFGIPLLDNRILSSDESNTNMFSAEQSMLTREDFDRFILQKGDVIHPLRFVVDDLENVIA